MDEAQSAMRNHLSMNGHRETDVREHVRPPVQHEHIQPEKHEKVYRPVDKEVHQEHHHTTVQPIQDREVLPEKHTHVQEGPQRKHLKRSGSDHVRNALASERIAFGLTEDRHEIGSTRHTRDEAPAVQGEHVHHHIHEHVQPVIEKETVQPHIIHRTKPVREVHEVEPQHHGATVLPPVSVDDLKRLQGGGELRSEPEERRDAFAGEPGPGSLEEGHLGGRGARGTTSLTRPDRDDGYVAPSTRQTAREPSPDVLLRPEGESRVGSASPHPAAQEMSGLVDKLNPKKDADGDGRAGIMD